MTDLLGTTERRPLVPCGAPRPVKCQHLSPGGSIKDCIAQAIVDDAEACGALRSGMVTQRGSVHDSGLGARSSGSSSPTLSPSPGSGGACTFRQARRSRGCWRRVVARSAG